MILLLEGVSTLELHQRDMTPTMAPKERSRLNLPEVSSVRRYQPHRSAEPQYTFVCRLSSLTKGATSRSLPFDFLKRRDGFRLHNCRVIAVC